MIPAGTTLEYVATGVVSTWSPVESEPANIESQLTNLLTPYATVKQVSIVPTTWALGGLLEYRYQARIVIATKEAHGAATDLSGYIVDALYRATGQTAQVVLASDPYAPDLAEPGAGSPLAWLGSLGSGLQASVTSIAIAAVVLGAAILYSKK